MASTRFDLPVSDSIIRSVAVRLSHIAETEARSTAPIQDDGQRHPSIRYKYGAGFGHLASLPFDTALRFELDDTAIQAAVAGHGVVLANLLYIQNEHGVDMSN